MKEYSPHQQMLLRIAIGDAKGAGDEFRFKTRDEYQRIDFDRYTKSAYADSDHFAGMYTDDTQMSIAVGELLASDDAFTKENLASYFVKCYKRDPIKGYAKGFQKFLDGVNSGEEFLKNIRPDSIRNGAAMRAVPIGILKNIDDVHDYAITNAQVTHDTPQGIASSVAVALMSHFSLYDGCTFDRKVLESVVFPRIHNIHPQSAEYFSDVVNMRGLDSKLLFGDEWKDKGVPCDATRTVGAVLHILKNYEEGKDILEQSIRLGGDTDSVASISLGIANIKVQDLPFFLLDGLCDHSYGKSYLLCLGNRLESKFPLNNNL